MNFKISERTLEAGQIVLDISGEVDVLTAPLLKDAIIGQVTKGASQIIINLEAVDYLDSTGLGTLIGGLKRTREAKTRLSIAGMNSRIRRLFDITGIDKIFVIHDTVADAVAYAEENV